MYVPLRMKYGICMKYDNCCILFLFVLQSLNLLELRLLRIDVLEFLYGNDLLHTDSLVVI